MDDYFQDFNRQQATIARMMKSPLEDFNRQQETIARMMKSPLEDYNRQQETIARMMKSPLEDYNRQQETIARMMKSPLEDYNRQQETIARMMKSPLEDYNRQQETIARMMKSPLEDYNRQQETIARMMKSPLEDYNRQQETIARMMKSPLEDYNRQQETIARMMKSPLEDYNRQQETIQKIMSSLKSTIKVQSFDFDGSLVVMNDVIANTYTDIETKDNSNPTQFEQELSTWLHEQVNTCFTLIRSLRNMRNVVDTKTAVGYTITLINLVSAIITIAGFLQEGNTEIYIHNYYEDVIIESEIDGNNTDIYIEKKETPRELQNENGDERYSGGEST